MEFTCRLIREENQEWTGRICTITSYGNFYETESRDVDPESILSLELEIMEISFYLPGYERGCYIAHFDDAFWNEETLTPLIGK